MKWLEEIGVEFDYKHVDMPVGAKWRRGHKPLKMKGTLCFCPYTISSMKMVEKFTDTPVKELIIEEGQVVGIIGEGRNGQK